MSRILTINNAIELAKKHGGEFLSKEFCGADKKYLWKCKEGHIFSAFYYNVYSGKWCRQCVYNSLRMSKSRLKEILKKHNIVSDINKYKNSKTRLYFRCCACNHTWSSCFDNICKHGCPKCSIKRKFDKKRTCKKDIQRVCKNNGCELIDAGDYKNQNSEILVKCSKCNNKIKKSFVCIKRRGLHCKNCYSVKNRIRSCLRNRINRAIKYNYKSGSAIRDLGCSIEFLIYYLEQKFYKNPYTGENMTWKNRGLYGWHIDHIIPLSSFNLMNRKQFLRACHYTNLQPLWAKENLLKGANR